MFGIIKEIEQIEDFELFYPIKGAIKTRGWKIVCDVDVYILIEHTPGSRICAFGSLKDLVGRRLFDVECCKVSYLSTSVEEYLIKLQMNNKELTIGFDNHDNCPAPYAFVVVNNNIKWESKI